MPSRLQIYSQFPWEGGLVTALDPALVGPSLTQADNLIFSTQSTKKKREGINYDWDDLVITSTLRESTTTTRKVTVTAGHRFTVGESIIVTGGPASYNTSAGVVSAVAGGSLNVVSYTFSGAASVTEGSTADTSMTVTPLTALIAGYDFWYGTTEDKTNRRASFSSMGKLTMYNPSTGARTHITDAGTAYDVSPALTKAQLLAFENRLIVAAGNVGNKTKQYFPAALGGTGTLDDLTNTAGFASPPEASVLSNHLGRLWCNDKSSPDRLHFSETGDCNVWQGAGDSGALDIGVGDGDTQGIVAIFPTFKGQLFVAKRTKLYRISGYSPESFIVEKVSDSIGCVGPNAFCAVDQDDIYFVSDRGVHSLAATDQFGGFSSTYKSAAIQRSFNDVWLRSALPTVQAAYVSTLNSVAFAVTEDTSSQNNAIYLYNIPLDAWYRWVGNSAAPLSCTALFQAQDVDQQRLYIGGNRARLAQSFSGLNYDTTPSGGTTAVAMTIRTGRMFIDGPQSIKGFKKFTLIYRPVGTHTITSTLQVDNFSGQAREFSSTGSDAVLGSFVLGQDLLGYLGAADAFSVDIDGYGRGISVMLQQQGVNEQAEILGFQVVYDAPGSWAQESRKGDTE